jgi:hypothetical protein
MPASSNARLEIKNFSQQFILGAALTMAGGRATLLHVE